MRTPLRAQFPVSLKKGETNGHVNRVVSCSYHYLRL